MSWVLLPIHLPCSQGPQRSWQSSEKRGGPESESPEVRVFGCGPVAATPASGVPGVGHGDSLEPTVAPARAKTRDSLLAGVFADGILAAL